MGAPGDRPPLAEEHGVDGWWAQQVTVDHEFARGLRARLQRPDGFAITKSETLPAPVEAVYAAWVDDAARARWLGNEFEISSTREHSSVRGRWAGGPSRIAVGLAAKGADKTQVQVQHEKLATAEDAEQAKRAWAERLTRPCSPTPDGAGMGVSAHDVVVR